MYALGYELTVLIPCLLILPLLFQFTKEKKFKNCEKEKKKEKS